MFKLLPVIDYLHSNCDLGTEKRNLLFHHSLQRSSYFYDFYINVCCFIWCLRSGNLIAVTTTPLFKTSYRGFLCALSIVLIYYFISTCPTWNVLYMDRVVYWSKTSFNFWFSYFTKVFKVIICNLQLIEILYLLTTHCK